MYFILVFSVSLFTLVLPFLFCCFFFYYTPLCFELDSSVTFSVGLIVLPFFFLLLLKTFILSDIICFNIFLIVHGHFLTFICFLIYFVSVFFSFVSLSVVFRLIVYSFVLTPLIFISMFICFRRKPSTTPK